MKVIDDYQNEIKGKKVTFINKTYQGDKSVDISSISEISYLKKDKLFKIKALFGAAWQVLDAEAFQLYINQCQEFLDEVKNG